MDDPHNRHRTDRHAQCQPDCRSQPLRAVRPPPTLNMCRLNAYIHTMDDKNQTEPGHAIARPQGPACTLISQTLLPWARLSDASTLARNPTVQHDAGAKDSADATHMPLLRGRARTGGKGTIVASRSLRRNAAPSCERPLGAAANNLRTQEAHIDVSGGTCKPPDVNRHIAQTRTKQSCVHTRLSDVGVP